jgi:hypothetical protein
MHDVHSPPISPARTSRPLKGGGVVEQPSNPTLRVVRQWRAWVRYVRRRKPLGSRPELVCVVWAVLLTLCYHRLLRCNNNNHNPHMNEHARRVPSPQPAASPAPQADMLAERRFFFCVSPGRAGSKYLSAVLGAANDVVAHHEPEPKLNGDVLREVMLRGRRAESFKRRALAKTAAIQDMLMDTAPDVAYAETSHMFIKTFADVVLESIAPTAANITIIILHRALEDIVWSQLRLGWFAPNHSGRNVWYYGIHDCHPSEKTFSSSFTRQKPVSSATVQVDRLVEYNLDIAARARALEMFVTQEHRRGHLRNVHIVHVRLEDISGSRGKSKVAALLGTIGLQADPHRLALLHRQDVNARSAKKDKFDTVYAEADVRRRTRELVAIKNQQALFP